MAHLVLQHLMIHRWRHLKIWRPSDEQ